MAVRNCAEIGENLQYVIKRLLANQTLLKYLYYTDKDPLSHADLTKEQKQADVSFFLHIRLLLRIIMATGIGSLSYIALSMSAILQTF